MFHLFFTLAPLALAAVIGQESINPKVNKAVDSILLIVQNELHHAVNEAILSVAETDGDLIEEIDKIKEKVEQLNAEEKKNNDDKTLEKTESDLKKRWYGYGMGYGWGGMYSYPYMGYGWGGMYGGYPYMGYGWGGMYSYPYMDYGWGGWYFKVRKDIKQTIEGKIIKGFKVAALQIVKTEYSNFLNDNSDQAHLDATQERLAFAWEKYTAYQQKNTEISSWIADLEQKLSGSSSIEKTRKLEGILKSSLAKVTDVFVSDQMDLPLSDLYYPSLAADEVDYV